LPRFGALNSLHCAAKKIFVLPMGRTLWFLSRSTGNAAAAFVFQIQHCISDRSVRFSNPALLLPQQCCFFKFNAAFAPAVLLFQIQRCKRGKNIDSLRIRDSTQMAFSLRVSIPAVEE